MWLHLVAEIGITELRKYLVFTYTYMCITVYCVVKRYDFHSLIGLNEMR